MSKINITWAEGYKNIADNTYTFYGGCGNGNFFYTGEEWESVMIFNADIRFKDITKLSPYLVEETPHSEQAEWIHKIIACIVKDKDIPIDDNAKSDLIDIIAREIDERCYELPTDEYTYALHELVVPIATNVLAHKRTTSDILVLTRHDGVCMDVVDYVYGATDMDHSELCAYMVETLIEKDLL